MFFIPTIRSLQAGGHTIFVLCISNGNYEGLGRVREDELRASCARLGIPASRVTIVDSPQLQDGPRNDWPAELVGAEVRSAQFCSAAPPRRCSSPPHRRVRPQPRDDAHKAASPPRRRLCRRGYNPTHVPRR